MNRYERMFQSLKERHERAFIPFVVVGDPNLEWSYEIIQSLIDSGADALELGIAFSDPIADGPVIQRADIRVLSNETTVDDALRLIAKVRNRNPHIPIGILTYANIVVRKGIDHFYEQLQKSGVDSLLIADVPTKEIGPFEKSAKEHGISQVLIVPPNVDDERLKRIAEISSGYVYVVTRSGVTGADEKMQLSSQTVFDKLNKQGAAPGVYGFGIAKPEHVTEALSKDASGVIAGSALTQIIERNLTSKEILLDEVKKFVRAMKDATKSSYKNQEIR